MHAAHLVRPVVSGSKDSGIVRGLNGPGSSQRCYVCQLTGRIPVRGLLPPAAFLELSALFVEGVIEMINPPEHERLPTREEMAGQLWRLL